MSAPFNVTPTRVREAIESALTSIGLGGQERRSDDLLRTLPGAVYATDAEGRITFFNQAAAELWGQEPRLGETRWCGAHRLYWPDGTAMPHEDSPLAVALRTGQPDPGREAVAERPDGSRVPFLSYPTPLADEAGTIVGGLDMLVDITDRKRAEAVAQRMAAIVESSDDAIIAKDLNGIISNWNAGAQRLFGYSPIEIIGKPVTTLIPLDRHVEEENILARIRAGQRIEHYETVRQRKDGSLVEISLTVSPIKDDQGRVIGASKIARDITERRRSEERQRLLIREMNHRVKNLFALAGGLVTLSARSAQTPREMADAVRDRLGALARAHELTLPDLSQDGRGTETSTTLGELIRTIVSPYVDGDDGPTRFAMAGPDVRVSGGALTGLALLLHETATNAAKYGAFSVPAGQVDVSWTVEDDSVVLTWRERGGPTLAGPVQTLGFGTKLASATMTSQLGGTITRDWRPEGLVISLSAPLARLSSQI